MALLWREFTAKLQSLQQNNCGTWLRVGVELASRIPSVCTPNMEIASRNAQARITIITPSDCERDASPLVHWNNSISHTQNTTNNKIIRTKSKLNFILDCVFLFWIFIVHRMFNKFSSSQFSFLSALFVF